MQENGDFFAIFSLEDGFAFGNRVALTVDLVSIRATDASALPTN